MIILYYDDLFYAIYNTGISVDIYVVTLESITVTWLVKCSHQMSLNHSII